MRLALVLLVLAACEGAATKTAPKTAANDVPAAKADPAPAPCRRPPPPRPTRTSRCPASATSRSLRQLTFGGENAEAYWSFDETTARSSRRTRRRARRDQIFTMKADGSDAQRSSAPARAARPARTSCRATSAILYASTHPAGDDCPPPPDRSQGYVWPLYPEYDIFTVDADGSDLKRLTTGPGYDAEATVSPKGDRIVFTSARDGDLELYTMDARRQRREAPDATTPGYDGGAFFSPDGKQIVLPRAATPRATDELAKYQALLAQGLVRPTALELCVMNADGSEHARRSRRTARPTSAPSSTPTASASSSRATTTTRRAATSTSTSIDVDGTGLERVTHRRRRLRRLPDVHAATARASSSAATAAPSPQARPTSSSPTGPTEPRRTCS